MKKSKGMQLGALLAALLIVSIAFVAVVSAQGANEQTKVVKSGKIMTPDRRHIMNESDFDKAIIESGTVKIPKTSSIAERLDATKKAMDKLSKKIKVPDNEVLDMSCDYVAEECSYRVGNLVKASAGDALPAINGWTERARDINSAGNTLFEGIWNVPSAPLDLASPHQTIFYFTAMQNSENSGASILQPVLEWGQNGRNSWDISSWYGINGSYFHNETITRVNVGDSIYGYMQLQTAQPTHWLIWTYDINSGVASSKYAYTNLKFPNSYVTLESYNINNCRQLSGGNDFTNLHLAGRTPSWTSWINQSATAACGTMGVNIRSPSEVILQTGRMP
ncbi:MAG: hypothetical protein O8C66_04485 [Candidatus Methanoperedens sp.]|nr:hypothetical protein [Candidatus Methanoperedens sp.]MCZ7369745.1 hypothetical protein [Candidatus Methanoperedens sp.]